MFLCQDTSLMIDNFWDIRVFTQSRVLIRYQERDQEHFRGGGGLRPIILVNSILRYVLKGKARTRPDIFGGF